MKRKYDRRTLNALLRHLAKPGTSTNTYLATHPRIGQEQIDAIFADLMAAVGQRGVVPDYTDGLPQPEVGSSRRSILPPDDQPAAPKVDRRS